MRIWWIETNQWVLQKTIFGFGGETFSIEPLSLLVLLRFQNKSEYWWWLVRMMFEWDFDAFNPAGSYGKKETLWGRNNILIPFSALPAYQISNSRRKIDDAWIAKTFFSKNCSTGQTCMQSRHWFRWEPFRFILGIHYWKFFCKFWLF